MAAHLDHEYRKRQHQRDLKSPGHVDQFRIRRIVERDLLRLQRHAADRTTARTDLTHLRMHRTGVDGAGRRRRLRLLWLEEFFRLGFETLAATRRAEKIFLPAIAEAMLRGPRIDPHAADRIDRGRRGFVRFAMLAAAAGRSLRLRAMMMMAAGRGARAVRVIH